MYCYAYIVHSAACFKGRPILMTMSLAQSPTAIPVLSSVEQCVKFDSDCLTTGRHTFSCECDGANQTWLQENFPEVPLIFVDICELHTGRALNILIGEESNVQDVDLSVAWQDR